MSKDYLYSIGDIVNDSLRIIEKSRNSKNGKKSYEASKETGINVGSISKACNNKIKYAGKINEQPLYWKYIN